MNPGAASPGTRRLWVGFLIATLVVAGGLSYLASSSPDGLDAATLRGCETIGSDGAEQLTGQCIAQSAHDHALADSPLADYTLGGASGGVGVAGVIGAVATLAVASLLFWVLARSRANRAAAADHRA